MGGRTVVVNSRDGRLEFSPSSITEGGRGGGRRSEIDSKFFGWFGCLLGIVEGSILG